MGAGSGSGEVSAGKAGEEAGGGSTVAGGGSREMGKIKEKRDVVEGSMGKIAGRDGEADTMGAGGHSGDAASSSGNEAIWEERSVPDKGGCSLELLSCP